MLLRKIILPVLITLVCALPAGAQSYLVFNGHEIKGDYRDMIKTLEADGFVEDTDYFKHYDNPDLETLLIGEFLGETGVKTFVSQVEDSTDIRWIAAWIHADGNWAAIYSKYTEVLNLYLEKYGEPTYRDPEPPETIEGDEAAFLDELQDYLFHYSVIWLSKAGNIIVGVGAEMGEYFVSVRYNPNY